MGWKTNDVLGACYTCECHDEFVAEESGQVMIKIARYHICHSNTHIDSISLTADILEVNQAGDECSRRNHWLRVFIYHCSRSARPAGSKDV